MGVISVLKGFDDIQPQSEILPRPMSGRSSLTDVTGVLDTALRLWDQDQVGAKSQVETAVALLRDHANDLTHTVEPASESTKRGLAPWQARKVKKFIDASLDSRIKVADCAHVVNLSKNYFASSFKVTFGVTVSHYIRWRRIERSKRLMLLSHEPLSQIAVGCGFADQAHYCRVFREVAGVNPNTWRRQNMP